MKPERARLLHSAIVFSFLFLAPLIASAVPEINEIELYPSAEARETVKRYSHGSYFLFAVYWIYLLALLSWVCFSGLGAGLRNRIRAKIAQRDLQVFAFWSVLCSLVSLAMFPLDLYRRYFREHAYGFSNMSFLEWMSDYLKFFAIDLALGGALLIFVYRGFRWFPRRWWAAGAAICIAATIFITAIQPELLAPLFNTYTPIRNDELRSDILSLAAKHDIKTEDVYEVDLSKQTKKINAWVTGVLGTQRIVLTDNLLNDCTREEILIVVAHEIGHYVLHHIWKGIIAGSLALLILAYVLQHAFNFLSTKYRARHGIESVEDIAAIPLLLILLAAAFLITMPVGNTFSRTQEAAADWFALQSTGLWEAEISIDKKLGQYREMDPHPAIEALLFTHPSLKKRIEMALEYRRTQPDK